MHKSYLNIFSSFIDSLSQSGEFLEFNKKYDNRTYDFISGKFIANDINSVLDRLEKEINEFKKILGEM